MPTYDMKNVKTGEVKEMFLKISEMEEMVASGEWQTQIGAPALVTHTGNIINKTSSDWKDHLKRIKKNAGTWVPNTINV
jgi:hypothetical protein